MTTTCSYMCVCVGGGGGGVGGQKNNIEQKLYTVIRQRSTPCQMLQPTKKIGFQKHVLYMYNYIIYLIC